MERKGRDSPFAKPSVLTVSTEPSQDSGQSMTIPAIVVEDTDSRSQSSTSSSSTREASRSKKRVPRVDEQGNPLPPSYNVGLVSPTPGHNTDGTFPAGKIFEYEWPEKSGKYYVSPGTDF